MILSLKLLYTMHWWVSLTYCLLIGVFTFIVIIDIVDFNSAILLFDFYFFLFLCLFWDCVWMCVVQFFFTCWHISCTSLFNKFNDCWRVYSIIFNLSVCLQMLPLCVYFETFITGFPFLFTRNVLLSYILIMFIKLMLCCYYFCFRKKCILYFYSHTDHCWCTGSLFAISHFCFFFPA